MRAQALRPDDGDVNRRVIQRALDDTGRVVLPRGRIAIARGLILADGMTLRGARVPAARVLADRRLGVGEPRTVLAASTASRDPLIHVVGSRTRVSDLTLEVPAATPGIHDGARWTALTVGDYLYPAATAWIEDIAISRLRIVRATRCRANSVAVMGAVRQVVVDDVAISGGGTGVAVHWGAVGESVAAITGPSYHPHDLLVRRLRIDGAFEGFYLSSVHDVEVSDVRCTDVEIGFRLLPGDNADRYHENPQESQVSRRIRVSGCTVHWRGPYGVRVAGWGRSEVDGAVRRLPYQDVTISSSRLVAEPPLDLSTGRSRIAPVSRSSVVVENATQVRFAKITVDAPAPVGVVTIDGSPAGLDALPAAP